MAFKQSVAIGTATENALYFKKVKLPVSLSWFEYLDIEERAEFLAEAVVVISNTIKTGKLDVLSQFLDEWRETALVNTERDVLKDIEEAEKELNSGGGKDWKKVKARIGVIGV